VFINCPFDKEYTPLYHAMIFAILDCGYIARSAEELSDSSQNRLQKIVSIIKESRYGIHDISRTELDDGTGLPRFNMPLELGLFLSAKYFGDKEQQKKSCLILDREPYWYQSYISDIAGQDIEAHDDSPEMLVKRVRNWLREKSGRKSIPGGKEIFRRYQKFCSVLPSMCEDIRQDEEDLTFADYVELVSEWLRENAT
jgi:hypothetical protein